MSNNDHLRPVSALSKGKRPNDKIRGERGLRDWDYATCPFAMGRIRMVVLVPLTTYLAECNIVKLVKKILGENEFESALQRLDRLTLDEARTTAMQTLEIVQRLVQNIRVVIDGGATHSPGPLDVVRC